jgi:catechol 2,3-dioxygenase-like lactoylglutathione lyase family enzyme
MRLALWVGLLLVSVVAEGKEIDLTRFVGTATTATPIRNVSFFGVPDSARLMVTGSVGTAQVSLNGSRVELAPGVAAVAVTLTENNTISVVTQGEVTVRVKQFADIQLHVLSRVHFNTNVSNFLESRAFYQQLGFETLSGFPDANTVAMAEAIGVSTPTTYDGSQGGEAGGYLLHGELISLGGFGGGVIDLIEFTIPRDESPPYEAVNHLGMARAVLHTTDIKSDFTTLTEAGVNFLSEPAQRSNGTWFAVFRDPDGTFYELLQVEGELNTEGAINIVELGPLNINVSDFERSAAWYQMFGYELSEKLPTNESAEVARAMGLTEPYQINGALLTHQVDASMIELVQWLHPHDKRPPYPIPVNHLGIHRTAFSTTDIEADVATLKAQGVTFVSPITPCCDGPDSWGSIVAFYDPDGTIIELVEQPVMNAILKTLRWFSEFFD